MSQLLGFSDGHSSLFANVRNLRTGYVSPQFHVVFDDVFQPFLVMVKMTWWLMQFVIICLLRMNSVWMGILHLLCMLFGSLSQCTEIEEKRCLSPCHWHEECQCIQAHHTLTSMPPNSLDIKAVSDNDKSINFASHVEM